MHGYFYAMFSGEKSDIEKLLSFLSTRSKGDLHAVMYETICKKYIQLPPGYDELQNNEETEISIGMNRAEAQDIGWFSEFDFFNATTVAVPNLAIYGGCCLEDASGLTCYESQSGSSTLKTYLQFSPDRIEVEIKISCQLGLDNVVDNMERFLQNLIFFNDNSVIRQMHLAFDDDDSIVIFHEGVPATGTEEDFLSFPEDMKQFCSSIAHTHPELELSGQIAIEETWSCSGRGTYLYISSQPGSQACYAKELSAESEPGIIFEYNADPNPIALDPSNLDFDFSDDDTTEDE